MTRSLCQTKKHAKNRSRTFESPLCSVICLAWITLALLLSSREAGSHHMKKIMKHMLKHAMYSGSKKLFLNVKGVLVPIPIPMQVSLPSIKLMKMGAEDKGDSGGGKEKVKIKYVPVPVPVKAGGGGKGGGWSGGGGWSAGGGGGWSGGGGGGGWSGGGGWETTQSEWNTPKLPTGDWPRSASGSEWSGGGWKNSRNGDETDWDDDWR